MEYLSVDDIKHLIETNQVLKSHALLFQELLNNKRTI